MPDYIKADPRMEKVWIEAVTDMARLNILSKTDTGTVEAYCILLERMRRLQASVMAAGETYFSKTKTGPRYYKNPDVDILIKTMQQLKIYAVELGITPASRGNVPSLLQADLFDRGNESKNKWSGFGARVN